MKVGLISLGCARTLVDSEVALGSLKKAGWQIMPDVRQAEVAIVNTCGFVEDAKRESIETILRLCEEKKKGRLSAVVVLGCLAQTYGKELRKEIGELDGIIGADSFEDLPRLLGPLLESRKRKKVFEVRGRPRYLLNEDSPRESLTPAHLAYVKISEGCLNACSYCVIPRMKGPHRSRPAESILAEIRAVASARRLSEINLIGQDTAAYGFDRGRSFELAGLLRKVDALGIAPWVRLLYAHPGHVTEALIEALAECPSLCKYVDFPIEHSHDAVLARMNRGVTREKMLWGIRRLRERMPDVAIRTTVIVGFPGETEEEFRDLLEFLEEIRFDRLGAFIYSDEELARSFNLPGKIPDGLKKERFEAVMETQQEIAREKNGRFLGKTLKVLIEEKDPAGDVYYGRTQADAPEVDGQVVVHADEPLGTGDFIDVRVTDTLEYDLVGVPASVPLEIRAR
ncbi:MAG: 30S ribosomal protein S12 methylthiotransferase RimO [Candidatus Omnitrophica bacterium]|nr:30S ribosomal protein S12 methylthiotransferase RimO [Candidatus Omnitrophota bacterium]